MARIQDGVLKAWLDGQVVKSNEYKQEREILRTAINDNMTRNETNATDVAAVSTRVTALETDNSENKSDIASLEGRMTAAEETNSSQSSDISSLQTRMTNAESTNTTQDSSIGNLQTRMTAAESKNTEQDTRLTGVEGKNTQQDNDISSLGSRVGALESSDSTQNNRLTNIESTNNGQGNDISDLQLRMNGVESKNISQDTRLDVAESGIVTLGSRASSLEAADTNFNTRLNDHTGSVNAHKAENISYSGKVTGATEVKTGLDKLNDRVDGIVGQSGSSNTEIVDARLGLDGTAHPVLKNRLDKMEGYLTENAKQSQTLVHGVQVVNTTQNSPVDFEVQGRTLVNNAMSNLLPSSYYVLADKKVKVRAEGKEGTLISGVAKFQKSNSVLTKADFVGKVSGSVTENAHISKRNYGTTLASPSSFVSESTSGEYPRYTSLDGVTQNYSTTTNGAYAQNLFSFNVIEQIERKMGRIPADTVTGKVAWLKANVNQLICNWYGFGSSVGGNKATLYMWNNTLNSWEATGSVTTNATVTKLIGLSTNMTNRIDSNGMAHYLAYAEASDGVTASQINTDFVELEIELKTTAVLDTRPILTRIANFEGKQKTSSVENAHSAKSNYTQTDTTLKTPSAFTIEYETSGYSNISALGGAMVNTVLTGNGYIAQHLFSFDLIQEVERNIGRIPKSTVADKVQWLKDNVDKIQADWNGFGSSVGGNKATFSIYTVSSSSWSTGLNHTSGTVAKLSPSYAVNIGNYVDANGFVHFLAYADASDGTTASTINTDYIELAITLKQGATLFEPVAPIYEVPVEDYNNILVSWAESDVLNRYPKVQGIQHVQNVAVIAEGENLLPPFYEWTLHANAKALSPYELELNQIGNVNDNIIDIPVLANTTYTLGFEGTGKVYLTTRDSSLNQIRVVSNFGNSGVTFTTEANAKFVRVSFAGVYATNGKWTYKNPTLNLGSTAKPFTPRNPSYLFAPTKLGQIGTVKDTLSKNDGVWYKRKAIEKDVVLDGSLGWLNHDDSTGFKRFKITSFSGLDTSKSSNSVLTSFNGNVLQAVQVNILPNQYRQISGDTVMYITVSDTDTGFGETYTPITDEIKAYFYGWQAKTVDVNGKPTAWKSLGDGTDAPTQTLAYVSTTKAPNYKPYSLSYVLATPQTLTIPVEGDITVSGSTQVEVTSGVIVREKASPVLNGGFYYINRTTVAGSNLKNRTLKILNVYKNTHIDTNRWGKGQDATAYGVERLSIAQADYDTTAEYTVTYLMLDRHLFTNNATEVKGFYESNLKGVVDNQVEKVADLSTQSSVNTQYIYRLLVAAKAAGWTV